MEDLFRAYWWLLFPLAFFIAGAYDSWLKYRRHRDTLDLIRTYAEQGRDPPPELLSRLSRRRKRRPDDEIDEDADDDPEAEREPFVHVRSGYRRDRGWSRVVLFGVMAAGFGYAAATDIYGAGEAFVIVTFVMGALCLATLVSVLLSRRD